MNYQLEAWEGLQLNILITERQRKKLSSTCGIFTKTDYSFVPFSITQSWSGMKKKRECDYNVIVQNNGKREKSYLRLI